MQDSNVPSTEIMLTNNKAAFISLSLIGGFIRIFKIKKPFVLSHEGL
jgi:hypothetical protein